MTLGIAGQAHRKELIVGPAGIVRTTLGRGVWGHAPAEKSWIQGLLRLLLVQFGDKVATVGQPAAKAMMHASPRKGNPCLARNRKF